MTEREGFLRAIAEDVYDDAPRLIFADWLEDHGEPERAEFIRVQCELEPMRDRYEIERAVELHAREDELLKEHRQKWLGRMPKGAGDRWGTGAEVEFRRGFVDVLSAPVRTFLDLGPKILKLHPTVRRLVMYRVNGEGERLAKCPALEGVPELELACWYSDADAEAIAASPHLGRLQVLELWLGRSEENLTDSRLCRIMASSKAWPALRELTLLDPDPDNHVHERKRLVSVANKAAGRKVAVYRQAYPDLFPFAPDFWYTYPGYLPDGRMAMADEDATTTPPTLCVLTFDKNGKQTKDVIRVPMPAEVLAVPPREWYKHKHAIKQQLIDVIGFRPGFIRVRDCEFPFDEHGYNRPFWDYFEDIIGALDSDDEPSWQDDPWGFGGRASYHVRDQQWVFGWDRYGDKSGTIHST